MKSYRSLIEKTKVIKTTKVSGHTVTYSQQGSKVHVMIDTIDLDVYPDMRTAERMATEFIKSYKDLVREANR